VSRRSVDPDLQLLRRAARAVAIQTALAVAAVVLFVAGAVLLIDEHQQRQQADRVTRSAWATADDVNDPPKGTWLVATTESGRRLATRDAPAEVAALNPKSLPNGISRALRGDRELVLFTGNRELGRVTAVYDLSPREQEERRLQVSLGLAALIGVASAGAVGALIGRRAVRPLGDAMALQRRFVADASHELRTPLSVLLLRAQLLRRHLAGQVVPARTAELDRLVHDTKVLGDVVNDMLLSVELQHRPQVGERVDLAALAIDVTASLQPLADRHSVELTADSPAASDSAPKTVNGAEPALRRAIVSLVDNAIAHTPSGGHVQVVVNVDLGDVTVDVIDDGEGLDPRHTHRLVERFSRGTSAGTGRRFGLGLALVNEVARAHGGSLVVDGEPGRGATFTLRLPFAG
jgi:signal transduction histidine kinase